jgi:hypothetical protein
MAENIGKWPSGHRKTEKSGHWLAAEKTQFPRRWYGNMISANLEVIWEMSDKVVAAPEAAKHDEFQAICASARAVFRIFILEPRSGV